MRFSILHGIFVGLVVMVAAEAGKYFRDPVAPDEQHIKETPNRHGLDPTRPPEEMAAACRREGKLLHATKTDGPNWVFDCL